jgi:hypothetical protein
MVSFGKFDKNRSGRPAGELEQFEIVSIEWTPSPFQ